MEMVRPIVTQSGEKHNASLYEKKELLRKTIWKVFWGGLDAEKVLQEVENKRELASETDCQFSMSECPEQESTMLRTAQILEAGGL